MTLKNSFLASMKENNKRRIWLWIVSLFTFVIIFPSIMAMIISQHRSDFSYYMESYGEVVGSQMIHMEVVNAIKSSLCVRDSAIWLLVAAIAIISGIQGFSYLYHKKKIDFYGALPIKMKKRFLVIWLNGLLIYLIPYLVGLIVNLLIVAGTGYMNVEIFTGAWKQFGMHLCFYLGVYHLVILAVMLTGNVVITYCAVGVLFLYEHIVRMMIMGYMNLFFKFYSQRSFSTMPVLSPFTMLMSYDVMDGSLWKSALGLLAFAVCTGTLAYICYLKRPAEAAGKAIAFSWPKSWLKILITIPAALLVGLAVASMVNYNPLYGKNNCGVVFFVIAVAIVFMSCLMQVIYEFDIKGMLHKKFHIFISAVGVIFIFCIFRFDLFGYDTYIPDVKKVESIAVSAPLDDYSYYSDSYWNEDLKYVSRQAYVEEHMYLTDVGTVNKLLKLSIEAVNGYENMDKVYADDTKNWQRVDLTYRMANKRDICRTILVDINDEEVMALIDRIEASEEFIAGAYMGASDTIANALADEKNKVDIFYGNGIYRKQMKRQEALELLKLYQEDIYNSSFLKFREDVYVGSMVLSFEKKMQNYTSYSESALKIYPFYEKSIAYLKEKGYYMEDYLNIEDVERIQVTNYNYELAEAARKEQEAAQSGELTVEAKLEMATSMAAMETQGADGFTTRAMYESEEEIKQLCEILYPRELLYVGWHTNKPMEEDYMVVVYFKPDSEVGINNDGMAYYAFAADEVPEFVKQDTAYTE